MPKAVAILDTYWDWEHKASRAGYVDKCPRSFRINRRNFTGGRLYDWLGHRDLLCTDACPQIVTSASQKGTPDKEWLRDNLKELWPFELLLVCGRTAQRTYELVYAPHPCRIIELPHPAARMWTREALAFARRLIQEGTESLSLEFRGGRLVAEPLLPF